ncbi:unnamed protein product, partial [Adineta steineri]
MSATVHPSDDVESTTDVLSTSSTAVTGRRLSRSQKVLIILGCFVGLGLIITVIVVPIVVKRQGSSSSSLASSETTMTSVDMLDVTLFTSAKVSMAAHVITPGPPCETLTFAPSFTRNLESSLRLIATGNFNGDKYTDLVIFYLLENTMEILFGCTNGSFEGQGSLRTLEGAVSSAKIADFNGDK